MTGPSDSADAAGRDHSPNNTVRSSGEGSRLTQMVSRLVSHTSDAYPTRSRRRSVTYDVPASYENLDDLTAEPPAQNPDDGSSIRRHVSREEQFSNRRRRLSDDTSSSLVRRRSSTVRRSLYDIPDGFGNLGELASVSPVENPRDRSIYRHHSLEDTRSREQEWQRQERAGQRRRRESLVHGNSAETQETQAADESPTEKEADEPEEEITVSKFLTQVYTLSYLVFFSLVGTLARLGLMALTTYPGAPVTFTVVWANFSGSIIMGFLAEDRMLFREEWGTPTYENAIRHHREKERDPEGGESGADTGGNEDGESVGDTGGDVTPDIEPIDLEAAKKAHQAVKKSIPLYIGMATGFCGSFTSFSTFMLDVFLALSNNLGTPGAVNLPESRNGGYSFLALLAVIISTVCLCLSGLIAGAHLAIAFERFTPSIPYPITRKVLDPLVIFVGWGCWLGSVLLSIWPPKDYWRGRATFALVLAPPGCLARFYLALLLNGKFAAFPLGTFTANVAGTAILGMAYDLSHVPIGGVVGCQVLQGVEDGFCGCLTTVSTWVAELSSLRRWHAYAYGLASLAVSLGCMVAIMGGVRWSDGFMGLQCSG